MALRKRGRYLIFASIICIGIVAGLLIARFVRRKEIPLEVEPIVLRSTNPAVGIAHPGDRVVVEFALSSKVAASPVVTIGGVVADEVVSSDGITFEASRQIAVDEIEGPISFAIRLMDTTYDDTSDGSSVAVVHPIPEFDTASHQITMSITSEGKSPDIARPGDTVALSIELSETVSDIPSVMISGGIADVTRRSNTSYVATRTISDDEHEGPAEITVEIGDATFEETTDGSSVIVSNGKLTISVLTAESTNPRREDRATTGDEVLFTVAASDALATAPEIHIAGQRIDDVMKISDNRYEARRIVDNTLDDGALTFTVSVVDRGGDRASIANATSDGTQLFIDKTPPQISNVRVSVIGRESHRAHAGDVVWLEFSANELLNNYPKVTIADQPADSIMKFRNGNFIATHTLRGDDEIGAVPFRIECADVTGNVAEPITDSDDGSKIVHVLPPKPKTIEPVVADIADKTAAASEKIELPTPPADTFLSSETAGMDNVQPITDAGSEFVMFAEIRGVGILDSDKRSVEDSSLYADSGPRNHAAEDALASLGKNGSFEAFGYDDLGKPILLRYIGDPFWFDTEIHAAAIAKADLRPQRTFALAEYDTHALSQPFPSYLIENSRDAYVDYRDYRPAADERLAEKEEPDDDEGTAAQTTDTEGQQVTVSSDPEAAGRAEAARSRFNVREDISEEPEVEEEPLIDPKDALAKIERSVLILSPGHRSYFGPDVVVTGIVKEVNLLTSATYIVSPERFVGQQSEILSGDVTIDSEGMFSLDFETANLEGDQQVRIELRYDDGAEAVESIVLLDGGDTIPSFAVESGDGGFKATWDKLSFVSKYRLNVSSLSGTSDEDEGSWAEVTKSPVQIEGLANGELYEIVLVGYDEDNEIVAESSPERVVPLDGLALKPEIETRYGSMLLSWQPITAANRYEIFRATGEEEMASIAVVEDATEYQDADIKPGREYRFSIKPADFNTPLSDAASSVSLTVPVSKADVVASVAATSILDTAAFGSNYLLGACGADGVRIFDVSIPNRPKHVATADAEDARGVTIYGSLLLVADGETGLRIFDIDNPTKPEFISTRKTSAATHVSVWSPDEDAIITFVADREFGVKVIDVTNPFDPDRKETVATVDAFESAIYEYDGGAALYLADGTGGVKIFDIEVGGITHVGTIELPDSRSVTIENALLVVADDQAGVNLFDIEEPWDPVELSQVDVLNATDIAVRDGYAYVSTEADTIEILKVTSPRLPVKYETVDVPNPQSVTPTLESIFIGVEESIVVLKNYSRGESYEVAEIKSPGNAYRVTVHETADGTRYAAMADHQGGVQLVDVNQPWTVTQGSVIRNIETEYARDIAFGGDYLYVADGPAGVRTIELAAALSEDTDPETLISSTWDTDGNARGIEYAHSKLFVADGNRGIKVFNLDEPWRPVQLDSVQTEYAVDLTVQGDYLYVADGDGGTLIYRIDADGVTHVATLQTMNTRCVAVDGDTLGIAGSAGLQLFNIANPEAPEQIGAFETGYAERVSISGEYAYVAEGIRGLNILSISNPESIYSVSQFENPFSVDVKIFDGHAYLADARGLRIISVVVPEWVVEGGEETETDTETD